MVNKIDRDNLYKQNLITIVEEHKLNCDSEYCAISTAIMLEIGLKLGLNFTDEEKLKFL